MIPYLVFNDPHIDVKPPSSKRLDDYREACLDKLRQIGDIAVANKVNVIVCTGDWFHKKNPQSVPYDLVNDVVDWLDAIGRHHMKVLTVAGNHDVRFQDTTRKGIRRQPFSIIARHRTVISLGDLGTTSGYVVQDSQTDGEIHFTGSSYAPPVYDADGNPFEARYQFESHPVMSKPAFKVHVVHASVMATVPNWKPYTLVDDALSITTARVLHSGHIHDDIGIFKGTNALGEDAYFTNIGSITRGSLTEQTLAREPQVLLVEVDTTKDMAHFTRIPLVCKPHTEIYDVAAYRVRQTKKAEAATWAAKLRGELDGAETEEETFEALVEQSALDHPCRLVARDILNEVGE